MLSYHDNAALVLRWRRKQEGRDVWRENSEEGVKALTNYYGGNPKGQLMNPLGHEVIDEVIDVHSVF